MFIYFKGSICSIHSCLLFIFLDYNFFSKLYTSCCLFVIFCIFLFTFCSSNSRVTARQDIKQSEQVNGNGYYGNRERFLLTKGHCYHGPKNV